jgi:Ca2+-binding RTX toxin-like protein
VTLDDRRNDGTPGERDDVASGVRTLYGSPHDDVLDARGAHHTVTIYAQTGDDRLFSSPAGSGLGGGPGDDVVHGGPGPDNIGGDEGDDHLYGGARDDVLSGYTGRNVMDGGRGHDR